MLDSRKANFLKLFCNDALLFPFPIYPDYGSESMKYLILGVVYGILRVSHSTEYKARVLFIGEVVLGNGQPR